MHGVCGDFGAVVSLGVWKIIQNNLMMDGLNKKPITFNIFKETPSNNLCQNLGCGFMSMPIVDEVRSLHEYNFNNRFVYNPANF